MKSIEPEKMQRLVDGELNAEATRQILLDADQSPALWRDIAVRFVEETTWQREFSKAQAESFEPVSKKAEATLTPPFPWSQLLMLAAGVLIAVTGGFLVGKNFNVINRGMPTTEVIASSDPMLPGVDITDNAIAATENQLTTTPVDFHMQLTDQYGNPVMNSDVPMYAQRNARQMGVLDQKRLPVEFVRQASDSGYGVDQNTNFISGQLNDGRRFVVPIRTINVTPGQ